MLSASIDGGQTPVHGRHVFYILRRPEPLGDRGCARPNARVHIFRAHEFAPHRDFAAQDARLLLICQSGGVAIQRVHRIERGSRLHVIEIIAGRKDARKAVPRSFGERLLAAPGLNHDVLRQIRIENFVPALHPLSVLRHYLLEPPIEVCLQIVGGLASDSSA